MPLDDGASLHGDALRVLRAWAAPTPEQELLRARYVRHLERPASTDAGPGRGVFRDCVPDHLTASVLVLSHDGASVLLTLHGKAERWFQLGGHLEAGDATLAAAAEREAREESGLSLVVDPVPVHLDVRFVAVADAGAEPVVSDESLDVRWWPSDSLPTPDLSEPVALARTRSGAA